MATNRSDRVQEALREEISTIVLNKIHDPRIGFLTITKVELTKDLRYARIYFSVLGTEKEKKLALKGLQSAKGCIKGFLSKRINLRFMPELVFKIDNSLENAQHIYEILNKLDKENKDEAGNSGDKRA